MITQENKTLCIDLIVDLEETIERLQILIRSGDTTDTQLFSCIQDNYENSRLTLVRLKNIY